ncbi:uncharacterized protein LOC127249702 [Andrographis paniculata]|uniref:uncharacterized protein LOC127249702 n=1 Tax=Andrographis paniculata TaxID=175694 RepID=UPI0021E864B4|nr:uncharacterized protein LOC127249702 [Andrographis paniculata]
MDPDPQVFVLDFDLRFSDVGDPKYFAHHMNFEAEFPAHELVTKEFCSVMIEESRKTRDSVSLIDVNGRSFNYLDLLDDSWFNSPPSFVGDWSSSKPSTVAGEEGEKRSYNGVLNESLKDYEENCRASNGEGDYKCLSLEDFVASSSSQVKDERDRDVLAESIFELHSAQEELENELLKFKDISKDTYVNTEFVDAIEERNINVETELEGHYKQKIEAEVENMVITRTIQQLRMATVKGITVLKEHKAFASEQMQMVDTLKDAEKSAAVLENVAKKLESACQDIAFADETMELRASVCKYGFWFVVQVVSLAVVVVAVFVAGSSGNRMEPAPT